MYNAKVNERGQVTIPKKIRDKANIKPMDDINIQINNQGQIIISKRGLFDDLNDLIKKDLAREGFSEYELVKKIPERKKELASALLKMAEDAEKEINKNEYTTLDDLKNEFEKD